LGIVDYGLEPDPTYINPETSTAFNQHGPATSHCLAEIAKEAVVIRTQRRPGEPSGVHSD
jgi:hypothetical protein